MDQKNWFTRSCSVVSVVCVLGFCRVTTVLSNLPLDWLCGDLFETGTLGLCHAGGFLDYKIFFFF